MCLTTTKKILLKKITTTQRVLPTPSIAKTDITVYKRLGLNSDGTYYSPYQSTSWRKGETKTAKLDIRDRGGFSAQVEAGLHAYVKKETALKYRGGNEVVVTCVIPRGSHYLIGKWGDIVSTALRFGAKRGRPLGVKDSYKRKVRKKRK